MKIIATAETVLELAHTPNGVFIYVTDAVYQELFMRDLPEMVVVESPEGRKLWVGEARRRDDGSVLFVEASRMLQEP